MVVMRIVVLCGCGLVLGGCLSPVAHTGSYVSLPPLAAVDGAPLPPVVEPGQLLKPDLGRTTAGVNPSDDLRSSERARVAWTPMHPRDFTLLSSSTGYAASNAAVSGSTSSVRITQPSKVGDRRLAHAQPYGRERTMDRLEREGQRDARPICGGC